MTNPIVYLGIDIGKFEHAWAVVDERDALLAQGTVVTTKKELTRFVVRMIKRYPSLRVGCEATGHYYEPIALEFFRRGVIVRVINPALTTTKALRRSLREVKTDRQDAAGIARRLRETQGDIGVPFHWNEQERSLQALGRYLATLKRARQALKESVDALKERPLSLPMSARTTLLDREIDRVVECLSQEAQRVYPDALRRLTEIRGVGDETASVFLAEAMDMRRFHSSAAFAAGAGLDPSVKESGVSIRGKGAITKAGSSLLRKHPGWMSVLLVEWNPVFRELFEHARARGKHKGVAYGIVARKFAAVAYQCVTRNVPFDPSKVGTGRAQIA